jgi:predicted DNA binding CopG/RHH family protein
MTKKPHVANYLDDEERELIEAIEADDYTPGQSLLTPELMAQMQEAARNTLNETSEKISIRIAQSDLARVKARALREGIPYQTLIKSIIHQAVR